MSTITKSTMLEISSEVERNVQERKRSGEGGGKKER